MRSSVDHSVRREVDHAAVVPWIVVALTIGGGVLRIVLARQDLFADELATYWIVTTRGLRGVVDTVASDAEITPPLGFVITWLTTRLGFATELMRLPALVAGIASIPLVYAVGVRTVGRGAALLAATLTTLSPFMIFYSAEARGYGLLMMLLLLSTWALLRAVGEGGVRWWVLYGLFVGLAAYTHYTSVFVLVVQLGWALWAHPSARRPLLVTTAAAALTYLPWLPSFMADLTSPTTDILGTLAPQSVDRTRLTLGHWVIGFPFAIRPLGDLPGVVALLMLALSMVLGAVGLVLVRSRLRERLPDAGSPAVLVVLLAFATPVGAALQSAIGTNVFSVRTLAASWPYLALATAALLTVGPRAVRVAASALAITAFAIAAVLMTGDNVKRPDYTRLARFTDRYPGAVILDGPSLSPGPLTNFDIEGSVPDGRIYRLFIPAQKEVPFSLKDERPDPLDVAQQAMTDADGGPIIIIGPVPFTPVMQEMVEQVPPGYELTATEVVPGMVDLQAQVYERSGTG